AVLKLPPLARLSDLVLLLSFMSGIFLLFLEVSADSAKLVIKWQRLHTVFYFFYACLIRRPVAIPEFRDKAVFIQAIGIGTRNRHIVIFVISTHQTFLQQAGRLGAGG